MLKFIILFSFLVSICIGQELSFEIKDANPNTKVSLFQYDEFKWNIVDSAFGIIPKIKISKYPLGVYAFKIDQSNLNEIILSPKEKNISLIGKLQNFKNGDYEILNSQENFLLDKVIGIFLKTNYLLDSVKSQMQKIVNLDPKFNEKTKQLADMRKIIRIDANKKLNEIIETQKTSFVSQNIAPVFLFPIQENNYNWSIQYDSYTSFSFFEYFSNYPNSSNITNTPFFELKLNEFLNQFYFKDIYWQKKQIDIVMKKFNDNNVFYYLAEFFLKKDATLALEYLENQYANTCGLTSNSLNLLQKSKALKIGNILPNLKISNDKNEIIEINNLFSNSQYSVLIFWSSICNHCKNEIPKWNDLIEKSLTKKYKWISISMDNEVQNWKKGIEKWHKNALHFSDLKGIESFLVKDLNIQFTPTIVIVDEKGKIIVKNPKLDQLKSLLD